MLEFTYLARPLIGAVIGYITNDIAIRMLFRPRTAKYIFGWKLPFTPGLIPKEKSRIAVSIGDAISKNLMNREVLEKTLLADEMIDKIKNGINDFVNTQKHNNETVEQFLSHYLSEEDVKSLSESVSNDLSSQIHTALSSAQLGTKIAGIVVAHVLEKVKNGLLETLDLNPEELAGLLEGMKNSYGQTQTGELPVQTQVSEIQEPVVTVEVKSGDETVKLAADESGNAIKTVEVVSSNTKEEVARENADGQEQKGGESAKQETGENFGSADPL